MKCATIFASGILCLNAFGQTTTSPNSGDALLAAIPEQFAFAAGQYSRMLDSIKGDPKLPRTFDDGRVKTVKPEDWTSGFFPGSLWFIYEATNDPRWLVAAKEYKECVEQFQDFTGHHDVGFIFYFSDGNGNRQNHSPSCRGVLSQGAKSLTTRYDRKVGLIRSCSHGSRKYPVSIDNILNLELLVFPSREGRGSNLNSIFHETPRPQT